MIFVVSCSRIKTLKKSTEDQVVTGLHHGESKQWQASCIDKGQSCSETPPTHQSDFPYDFGHFVG